MTEEKTVESMEQSSDISTLCENPGAVRRLTCDQKYFRFLELFVNKYFRLRLSD